MRNAPPPELPALLRRSAVLQAVRERWPELAENTLLIKEENTRVLIACSGGPDSTALLLTLWALREPLRLELRVACVDHQLRPESADEAAAVCQVAQRLGLPSERIAVEVPPGPSRAARARQVRYEALAQAAARSGCSVLAVGHNRDDQSETMLMRWLGGSGLRGLVGMSACRPLRPGGDGPRLLLVRPLLSVPRAAIDALLALAREHVRPLPYEDPTNASPRYQRSRLRHQLLPLLRREQPRLDAHLGELSEQLRADAECLDELADAALRRIASREHTDGGPLVTLPVLELQALPRALFARVVQRAAGGGLGQAHLDALWRLCQTTHGSQSLELPQRRAERRYDHLLLSRRAELPRDSVSEDEELSLSGPGELLLPAGGLRLRLRSCRRDELPTAAPWLVVDPSELPLRVRPARRGERIGLGPAAAGHRKISDVLIDRKVPRRERPHVRVLASREHQILWLLGTQGLLRASRPPLAQAPVGADAGRLLVVELLQP